MSEGYLEFGKDSALEVSAHKNVTVIKEWNERAEKLATSVKKIKDATDNLQEIAKAAEAAQRLGQFAGALGVASVGLDIVVSFMDTGPSDTELVLDAIAKLSDKVTDLWDHVDARLAKIEAAGNFNHAQTPIKNDLLLIKQLKKRMYEYSEAVKNGREKDIETAEDQLLVNFDETKLGLIMDRLAEQAVNPINFGGTQYDHFREQESILAAAYDLTLGDIDDIGYIGINLIEAYKTSLMALGMWQAINWKRKSNGEAYPSEERALHLKVIDKEYGRSFTAICNSLHSWTQLCQTWVSSNIDQRLEQIFTEVGVATDSELSCRHSASAILERLEANFSWMGFCVLVYEPMTNWKYHGWTGGEGRYKHFMPQTFKDHSKANLLVFFREKADATISENHENYDHFLDITNSVTTDYDLHDISQILNWNQTLTYRGPFALKIGSQTVRVTKPLAESGIMGNVFLLPHKFCANGLVVHIDKNRYASLVGTQGARYRIPNWWPEHSMFKYFYMG
jgi:hypothetical protein